MRTRVPRGVLVAVAVAAFLAPALPAETVDAMLKSGELKAAYNPVLLDYLLNEGSKSLPDAARKLAIDQLVTALQADIEITPEEQRAASLAAAGAGLAQLFGGSTSREIGDVAQDATHQIWSGWIDSAITLDKAGYHDQAVTFFETCIGIYPYSDLKGRCAIALAKRDPATAVERLMALTRQPDAEVVKPVLRLLGELAGSEGFPAETRKEIIARIESFGSGMKKATYGLDVCEGLVRTGDPAVVPTLHGLSKGLMNASFYPCSRRGLLLTFRDRSVVPLLEKDLKGGMLSTAKPHDKLFSVRLLVLAGEDSGYAWAREKLVAPKAGSMNRLMKTSSDDFDYKPSLVSLLAEGTKEKSLPVLTSALEAAEAGSWLQTWIAIAMLELGDSAQIDRVRRALSIPEWDFTAVRAAEALAGTGDFSGIVALGVVYDRALAGKEESPGREFLAYLAGEGAQWESSRDARERRAIRLRSQIAAALASLDRPESVPLLEKMLADPDASVRVAAAYGLMRMRAKGTAAALAKAIQADYGTAGKASRNPVLQARITRYARATFAGEKPTASVIESASKSPYVSVRFMAATMKK